jgi:hypothetical protein
MLRRATYKGLLGAIVILTGSVECAGAQRWGPTWSEVTGNLYSRATIDRHPATIKQLDGRHETKRIVKAEPGTHELVIASPMRKGFSGSDARFPIELDPCKRYYVNAQFKAGTGPDWEPVLAFVEPIAGCKLPAK